MPSSSPADLKQADPAGGSAAGLTVGATDPPVGSTAQWVGYLLVGIPVMALAGLIAFSSLQDRTGGWTALGVGSCTLAGSAAVGALLGFLFGIPRSLQTDGSQAIEASGYRPNTNLEQISDWLTKILVGVGLVEFKQFGDPLRHLVGTVGQGMGDTAAARDIAACLLAVFTVWGFLVSYVITRTQAARVFRESDIDRITKRAITEVSGQVAQRLDEQAMRDARLLSLIDQVLNPQVDGPGIDQAELNEATAEASTSARLQAFLQASRQRRQNWRSDKQRMQHTVAVFRALIASDLKQAYHRNHGELGFALKDLEEPQWSEALEALSEAIRRRGPARAGFPWYEFNRVLCLIQLDGTAAAPPDVQRQVLADLQVLAGSPTILNNLLAEPTVLRWLGEHAIDPASLRTGRRRSP